MGISYQDRTDRVIAATLEALREGTHAAGTFVEGRARELCPVRSGRLRDSIHTELLPQVSSTRAVCLVGPDTPYDKLVHDGHRNVPGKPFMTTAYNETLDEQQEIIRDFVREAISSASAYQRNVKYANK